MTVRPLGQPLTVIHSRCLGCFTKGSTVMSTNEPPSDPNVLRYPGWGFTVLFLFLASLFALVPGKLEIANAQSGRQVDLVCPCSYDIQGNYISFGAARLTNRSASRTDLLKLQVWATQTRYAGGSLHGGHRLAEESLGKLNGNSSYPFLSYTKVLRSRPVGTYHITIILTEYDMRRRKDIIRDYYTSDRTFTFAGGGGQVDLVCPCSYDIQGNYISFGAARLTNRSASRTDLLKLQVWATQTRYAGGSLHGGHRLAEESLGKLNGNGYYTFLSYTKVLRSRPVGTYHITIILTEYDRQIRKDRIRDYYTSDRTFTFAGGGGQVDLVCPCPYDIQGNYISFGAARLTNRSASRTDLLKLQVWATQTRYAGGSLHGGHRLAEERLGKLNGNSSYPFLSYTKVLRSRPVGTYHITIILTEYDMRRRKDIIRDYYTSDRTFTFAGVSSAGIISGTLQIPEGYVLDGDTANPDDPVVENNNQAQRVSIPSTILGFAGNTPQITDEFDVYGVTLQGPVGVSLSIADPDAADLDLYLAEIDTNGRLIALQTSLGTGRYETLQTAGLTGEYLVIVVAKHGKSNYILSLGITGAASVAGLDGALSLDAEFVPDELIVKYAERLGTAQQQDVMEFTTQALGLTPLAGSPSGPILMRLQDTAAGPLSSQSETGFMGPLHYATTEQAAKARTLDMIKLLRRGPTASYAEPNYLVHATAVPNDQYYERHWHYEQINLPAAWNITTGDDDIVVAVLDSGVVLHEDLEERMTDSFGRLLGYDFVSNDSLGERDGYDSNPIDEGNGIPNKTSSFHGTHVAGTIGATTNNRKGIAGVTWRGKLMPIRVLGKQRTPKGILVRGSSYDISEAIKYAAKLDNASRNKPPVRANVMNLSLGSPCDFKDIQVYKEALKMAQNAGVIVVHAAGNDNCGHPTPISRIDGVISVAAVNAQRQKAWYSNFGPKIDVAAPGGNTSVDHDGDGLSDGVFSTVGKEPIVPTKVYKVYGGMQGTSMAAPHVAGVVALMLSVNPDLTPNDINMLIADTHPHPQAGPITQDLGTPGRDDVYGYGLIDAYKAVQVARAMARNAMPPPLVNDPELSVFPETLNFGSHRAVMQLELRNIGTGNLRFTDIRDNSSWLTVARSPSSGSLTVRANRAGLEENSYLGHIFISSNGGDRTIPVAMKVESGVSGGTIGTVYVLVLDASTLQTSGRGDITGAAERYFYRTPKVPGGTYLVIAGTDRDDDQYICDSGEACGIYPLEDSPREIEINGDQTGIDFAVSANLLATAASSQDTDLDVVPPEGFQRSEPEGFRR